MFAVLPVLATFVAFLLCRSIYVGKFGLSRAPLVTAISLLGLGFCLQVITPDDAHLLMTTLLILVFGTAILLFYPLRGMPLARVLYGVLAKRDYGRS